MAKPMCEMMHLCSKLADAVADVLDQPSGQHGRAVHDAVRTTAVLRVCQSTGGRCYNQFVPRRAAAVRSCSSQVVAC